MKMTEQEFTELVLGKIVEPLTAREDTPNFDLNSKEVERVDSDRIKQHRALVELLHEVYKAKNRDYGDSFGKSIKRYGVIAALTRMSDKWNRLENLMLHGDPSVCAEGVTDTLLDLANYCLMTVIAITESEETDD